MRPPFMTVCIVAPKATLCLSVKQQQVLQNVRIRRPVNESRLEFAAIRVIIFKEIMSSADL